jgi:hypothetical protein
MSIHQSSQDFLSSFTGIAALPHISFSSRIITLKMSFTGVRLFSSGIDENLFIIVLCSGSRVPRDKLVSLDLPINQSSLLRCLHVSITNY